MRAPLTMLIYSTALLRRRCTVTGLVAGHVATVAPVGVQVTARQGVHPLVRATAHLAVLAGVAEAVAVTAVVAAQAAVLVRARVTAPANVLAGVRAVVAPAVRVHAEQGVLDRRSKLWQLA